ncbi:MAG: hypothetical protein JO358_17910 [Alphaproteobacteria bacterium]|nr:hypothetical protein [Alphaproteobacteria bacterium]
MVEIRRLIRTHEAIFSELGFEAPRPVARAVEMAVILNLSPGASSMISGCYSKRAQNSANSSCPASSSC